MTFPKLAPLALLGAVALAGCLVDEEDRTYQGPAFVEFSQQQFRNGVAVRSADGTGSTLFYRRNVTNPTAAVPSRLDSLEVNVVTTEGRGAAVTVPFTAEFFSPEGRPGAAAYELVTKSPLTVPAGQYTGKIYFRLLRRATYAPTSANRDTIRFVLQDAAGHPATPNARRYRVAIQ